MRTSPIDTPAEADDRRAMLRRGAARHLRAWYLGEVIRRDDPRLDAWAEGLTDDQVDLVFGEYRRRQEASGRARGKAIEAHDRRAEESRRR